MNLGPNRRISNSNAGPRTGLNRTYSRTKFLNNGSVVKKMDRNKKGQEIFPNLIFFEIFNCGKKRFLRLLLKVIRRIRLVYYVWNSFV